MKKVIHLISSLRRGGRERQLAGILKSSHNHIWNLAIVFNKSHNSYDKEYSLDNQLFYLDSKNPFLRFIEILKIIRRVKPDIIWSWGGFEATFGMLVSLFSSAKHINGSIRHGILRFNRKQVWRMIILHLSRNIVANSYAGLKANRLTRGKVMYNGLDDHFFLPVDKAIYLQANPYINKIVNNGGLIFISIANLVPYKDYYTVLKALEKIKINEFDFNYLIVGEGPDRNRIEKIIHESSLKDNVFLLGHCQEIKELLSVSDIFIHSSMGEGCSNAILEAMAAGLPVIASNTGGTSEIVDKSVGRLFEYQNVSELTKYLIELISSSNLRQELGRGALSKAKNTFSIERMLNDYENILKQVILK